MSNGFIQVKHVMKYDLITITQ